MFGDAELPLALIMEEILGWEKPPKKDGDKEEEADNNQQVGTTFENS